MTPANARIDAERYARFIETLKNSLSSEDEQERFGAQFLLNLNKTSGPVAVLDFLQRQENNATTGKLHLTPLEHKVLGSTVMGNIAYDTAIGPIRDKTHRLRESSRRLIDIISKMNPIAATALIAGGMVGMAGLNQRADALSNSPVAALNERQPTPFADAVTSIGFAGSAAGTMMITSSLCMAIAAWIMSKRADHLEEWQPEEVEHKSRALASALGEQLYKRGLELKRQPLSF